MKYQKPKIVTLAAALDAIQGSCAKQGAQADGCDSSSRNATPAAYEADE